MKKLLEFLDGEHIKYTVIKHSQAYTAQEIAAAAHIAGHKMAKTVLLKINGKLAMAVLPASYRIEFDKLKAALETEDVRLASEQEFKDKFPGSEVGAMPPFGNLYDLPVYVAATLVEDDDIVFNGGSHVELVKLAYTDFERLAEPKILRFTSKQRT